MAQQKTTQQPDGASRSLSPMTIGLWVLILLFISFTFFSNFGGRPGREISYDKFLSLVQGDKVQAVVLRGHAVQGKLKSKQPVGGEKNAKDARFFQQFSTRVPSFGADNVVALLEKHHVKLNVVARQNGGWVTALVSMLPWLLFIVFMVWIVRGASRAFQGGVGGQMNQLTQFMRRSVRKAQRPKVSFADVAGQDTAKQEVSELVDFLRNPEQFRKMGAKVPKGVLLFGPPGTGKTLLSRALAGEADVPFYSISGSEFIEMFVGVGASRVRNLFEEAKKNAPAIIFIDELDSIGRKRGTGLGGGHDEREQTLNQILAEMDGFESHDAVIVLAATNRPDVLDPALLRPGRFDRHVTVEMPDRKGRLGILHVHTKNVPLADDVDLEEIAASTAGFSGADLENLINEAALRAARDKQPKVTKDHLEEARDKVTLGPERPLGFTPDERRRLAVHESGHTIVGYFLPNADPVHKVSIIPHGRALGGTQQLPREDHYTYTESYLRDRLAVMLGGRTAEKMVLGDVSTGAENDIQQATRLARTMVTRWGMSQDLGPIDLSDHDENPFLGEELARPRRHSEHSAVKIDEAVHALLDQAQGQAEKVIKDNRDKFDRLADALCKEETLYAEHLRDLLGDTTQGEQSAETPAPRAVAGR